MLRILLVEDEEAILELFQRQLASIGMTNVKTVATCEEGIAVITGMTFDVVITDFNAGPEKTGADVLRAARLRHNATDVVIVTGQVDPNEQREIRRLGVDGFLAKPYKFERLVQILRDLGRYSDPEYSAPD